MTNLEKKIKSFLYTHLEDLQLKPALFYNWQYGLRFGLGVGETNTEYFEETIKRASVLFEAAFDTSDNVLILISQYKYKRQKIRHTNYLFKQIESLDKKEIVYFKQIRIDGRERDIINTGVVETTVNKINYKNIFTEIAYSDFPSKYQNKRLGDIYFVNISKNLIFHMYDDRGLDIIATTKEALLPLYINHNKWILDYDRPKIDKLFKKIYPST